MTHSEVLLPWRESVGLDENKQRQLLVSVLFYDADIIRSRINTSLHRKRYEEWLAVHSQTDGSYGIDHYCEDPETKKPIRHSSLTIVPHEDSMQIILDVRSHTPEVQSFFYNYVLERDTLNLSIPFPVLKQLFTQCEALVETLPGQD